MNALTVEVLGRLADTLGSRENMQDREVAALWMCDGAAVLGTTLDGYAEWLQQQMTTEGGMDEYIAHCEAIINRATVREYQRPKN